MMTEGQKILFPVIIWNPKASFLIFIIYKNQVAPVLVAREKGQRPYSAGPVASVERHPLRFGLEK